MGKAHTNSFIPFARLAFAGSALLLVQSVSALSQDRSDLLRRCLSITDVNERVDCFEAGGALDSEATPTPKTKSAKQQGAIPSFDCRAARNSIERTICGDVTLSEWESRMGQLFQQVLRLTKDRQSHLDNQRVWLAQRDGSCGALADVTIRSCVLEMTKSRATTLTKTAASAAEVAQTSQPSPTPVMPTTSQRPAELPSEEARGNLSSPTPPIPKSGSSTNTPVADNNLGSIILLAILVFGTAIALRFFRAFRRKQRLVAKYGEEAATLIIAGKVWQGMTEEQLTESWGNPADVGREIIKAKTKETWKYGQTGRNRFSNRVYLENGIVIGWKI